MAIMGLLGEKKPYVSPDCTASAIVRVTVEVRDCGAWGGDCKLDQIEKQAAEEAVNYIRQRTEKDHRLTIVGMPKVTAVITQRKDD